MVRSADAAILTIWSCLVFIAMMGGFLLIWKWVW